MRNILHCRIENRAEWMTDPFSPEFYPSVMQPIFFGLNSGLNFVTYEQGFILGTTFFEIKLKFLANFFKCNVSFPALSDTCMTL